jgi:hypothetical protein
MTRPVLAPTEVPTATTPNTWGPAGTRVFRIQPARAGPAGTLPPDGRGGGPSGVELRAC